MIKNPPCNAGDVGWISGWGTEIPHAAEQLISYATTKIQHSQIKYFLKKDVNMGSLIIVVLVVQWLSHVRLFATPWTARTPGFSVHHLPEFAQT